MKTLLSKFKLQLLSTHEMAQISGGDSDVYCEESYVDTYISDTVVVPDVIITCFPAS